MKKRGLWIITLVVVLVVLLSGAYYVRSLGKIDINQKLALCEDKPSEDMFQCEENIFRENSEVSLCESIISEYPNYNCYKFVAINTEDPFYCDNVVGSNYCYVDVAVALKDESICNSLQGFFSYSDSNNRVLWKDHCISSVRAD